MRRVAIIDDNDSERFILRDFVEGCGFNVVADGANGQEAVVICRRHKPDVVIMDIRMPVMDGLEAARVISRTCPTPIVILTADHDEATITRAVEAGAMAYMVKPVRLEEIMPTVELAVSRFAEIRWLHTEVDGLKDSLKSRRLVEKAKGLLMAKEGITEDQAYRRIRSISMDRRKSITEIASILILALGDADGEPVG